MALFGYSAKNLKGEEIHESKEAESEESLRRMLLENGYYITSIKNVQSSRLDNFLGKKDKEVNLKNIKLGKIKKSEFFIFCRQFSIILNSGISIVEAVDILVHQTTNKKLQETLKGVHEQLRKGVMLSNAMRSYKDIFPEFFVNMVQVGEVSGNLDSVLNKMAEYYEKEYKTSKKIKKASMYPIIVVVITIGVITLLMLKVIPTFSKMLLSMGGELPLITKVLIGMSDFIVNNIIYLTSGLAIIIVLISSYATTQQGRYKFDQLKLGIPIIRDVVIKSITSKFARSLGLLLKSGIPIVRALEIMSDLIGNKVVQEKFNLCCVEVKEGKGISSSLKNMSIFPEMLIHMVTVGEKTGELDDILSRTAGFFEEEVDNAIDNTITLIEPIMIVFLAVIVGIVILAVMLPMTNMMQSLKGA